MTEQICKIILLGESGVGKTCIINRYVEDKFSDEQEISMGAGFSSKELRLSDNQLCKLDIWDTAGSEKFRSINKIFYQESAIAILVYDITNKKSFEEIQNYWVEEVKNNGPENISK